MAQEDLVVLLALKAKDEASAILGRISAELRKLHGSAVSSLGSSGLHGILSSLSGPAQVVATAIALVGASLVEPIKMPPGFERALAGLTVEVEDVELDWLT